MTSAGRHPWGQDSAGVTLVELMIVLVVVAIGILALSAVQTKSSSDVYSTGRQTRALELANAQMETTRGAGFALAISDSGQADGFQWNTQVNTLSVDFKQINVTVSWTDNGAARSVQLDNLISDR